jgi:hypothetical protein
MNDAPFARGQAGDDEPAISLQQAKVIAVGLLDTYYVRNPA